MKEIEIYPCIRIGINVEDESKKILIIGGSGNLGEVIINNFSTSFGDIIITDSNNAKEFLESNEKVQLIVNAANRYYPEPTQRQINEMENSIVGLAESIKNYCINKRAPLIYFSTYLQYAPENLQPWSDYSQFKNIAGEIFRQVSDLNDIPSTEIILYDNYGGTRKSKIFDLMLKAANKCEVLDANPGDSKINLSHVNDIVNAIKEAAIEILSQNPKVIRNYQFKSTTTYSLKELEVLILETLNLKPYVNWGAIKYRSKEVFELWDCAELPGFWTENESIKNYILQEQSNSQC